MANVNQWWGPHRADLHTKDKGGATAAFLWWSAWDIDIFIYSTIIECLLHARHCSRYWRLAVTRTDRNICLGSMGFWWCDKIIWRKKGNQGNSKQEIHSGYFWRKGVKEDGGGGGGRGREGRKEKSSQEDARVGDVPRLSDWLSYESSLAVLYNLHVCCRDVFA